MGRWHGGHDAAGRHYGGAEYPGAVYGKIDPGQDAPVGNYKDTVIMSVNP